ncbi:MAG: hypothetical protein ABTQ29_03500 [Siculibacillus sp.]
MRSLILIAALAGTVGVASAEETWTVTEGVKPVNTGGWSVTVAPSGEITGEGTLQAGSKSIRFSLTGKADGTTYRLERVRSSDGLNCTYTGAALPKKSARDPREIKGSVNCGRDGASPWTAREQQKPR